MSFVWKYFEICAQNVKIAICNVCKGKVDHGGTTAKAFGTTNLIRHLKVHHPKEHDEYQKSVENAKQARPSSLTQPSVKSVILQNQSYSRDSSKAQVITKKVMEFIVLDVFCCRRPRFPPSNGTHGSAIHTTQQMILFGCGSTRNLQCFVSSCSQST